MALVTLVPMDLGDDGTLVDEVGNCIRRTFQVTVVVRAPWFEPRVCFDQPRGQYNARMLLGQLLTNPAEDESTMLGIIKADLFSPALTYVFGEALLGGRAAVVSTERLRSEAYGLPRDDRLLSERVQKEALHELGHTLGLVHCRNTLCVMHSSIYPEQVDFKSAAFCDKCRNCLLRGLAPTPVR